MDFNSIKSKLSIVTGLHWSAFFLALRAAVHLGLFLLLQNSLVV